MDPKLNEQEQARNFFFNTDFTQDQICELLSINRKTLYLWIKEGGWKQSKYAACHAPSLLIEQYYHQLGTLNMHIVQRESQPWPTKEEGDTIRRLTMAIKHIRNGKQTAVESIQVFHSFTDTLRKKDIKLLQQLIPHVDKYVKDMTEDGQWLNYSRFRSEEARFDEEYGEWLATQPQNEPAKQSGSPQPQGEITPPVNPPAPVENGTVLTEPQNNDPNSEITPASGDSRNGASNGEMPPAENTPKPLPTNTQEERNNIELPTKKIEEHDKTKPKTTKKEEPEDIDKLLAKDPLKFWELRMKKFREEMGFDEDDEAA
jgi:hypothetical protein